MSYVNYSMSNISLLSDVSTQLGNKILTEDHEGYKLLSENKEIAFSLCKSCLTMNFFSINAKEFNCSNCLEVQTA
jgi:hypothetical protein